MMRKPSANHGCRPGQLLMVLIISFALCTLTVNAAQKNKNNAFQVNPEMLKVMKWRSIGPHRGGRVVAVAGHPSKKKVFYFGGTGSGVWQTTNGGKVWKNISDGFFKTSSVGAITVSSADPDVIYVGMGETCLRGNITHGDGVYKSSDGGKTWSHMGLTETRQIARIRVHPQNSNIVYVAALGHAFGQNEERGVFRSINGGESWQRVLFKSAKAGAIDLLIDPSAPEIIYAAFWEVQRMPWGMISGGPGSGLFKSLDGGNTWQDLGQKEGFPRGIKGRIGITLSAAKPETVYAIVESEKSGIFRSDDRGETWRLVSTNANMLQRPWYYSHLKADPLDAETFYVMNVGFWKTSNGGKKFGAISVPHGDNHDLWIDDKDPKRMIEANDGGATVSFDGGKSWSTILNQPTAQFYHATTDNQFPYRVYGAQQDNSTISVPSRTARGRITESDWYPVGGCESGYIAVSPENANIVFAGCYGGMLTRYDHEKKLTWDISVWPDNPMGAGAEDLKYRFQWTFPIMISSHDPDLLYVTANHVFRSFDEGHSWEEISPDLTRNDKSKMISSGGPLTKDNTSVEYYGTIFALAESPLNPDILWAGSDDGLIHLTRDRGTSWTDVTPKNLPEWSLISIIDASPHDEGTAYVAATRYKLDDLSPYLLKTADYGQTWESISAGIPADDFTRVIREDPNVPKLLYAGSETGVYFSFNDGLSWQPLQLNLPVTPIHDLVFRDNDLVAGTHGRSFWILDDLTLFYQMKKLDDLGDLHLTQPRPTVLFQGGQGRSATAGESLPAGVIVNYYLKEKPTEPVTVEIFEEDGSLVETFSSKRIPGTRTRLVQAKAGWNRFIWNFRYPGALRVPRAIFWMGATVVPIAAPGKYRLTMKTGTIQQEMNFKILPDPNLEMSVADYRAKFELMVKIREKVSGTHEAINNIRSLQQQLADLKKKSAEHAQTDKINTLSQKLNGLLVEVEDELIQHRAKATQDLLNYPIKLNNKLTALASTVSRTPSGPTKQALAVFEDLSRRVDVQLQKFKLILEKDVPEFNRVISAHNLPALSISKKDDD